jgi:hypothetical protein
MLSPTFLISSLAKISFREIFAGLGTVCSMDLMILMRANPLLGSLEVVGPKNLEFF